MANIDLSSLPAPQVIEALDYETILAERKAALLALFPAEQRPAIEATLAIESEPLTIQLQENAYRELVLRNRVNDASRGNMLAYATGADLEQIGARYKVVRLVVTPANPTAIPPVQAVMESDDRLRTRIQMAYDGLSIAGPIGAYKFHALSASGQVLDVSVQSPEAMVVQVNILSTAESGIADATLIATVGEYLSAEDRRPLCDIVQVQSAQIVPFSVEAVLHCYPGPSTETVLGAANNALNKTLADLYKLGRDVTRSALYAALHQAGVQRVEIISPVANVVVEEHQAAQCTAINLTTGASDV